MKMYLVLPVLGAVVNIPGILDGSMLSAGVFGFDIGAFLAMLAWECA